MRKYIIISLVLILLATTAVPVLAGNGQGNGVGQGNQYEDQSQDRAEIQEREQVKEKVKLTNRGLEKNKNRENNKWQYTPFYLQGIITSVDAGAQTVTVTVVHANAKVKAFMGTDLVIKVPETAVIFQVTQGNEEGEGARGEDGDSNKETITLAQLQTGQKIALHGRLLDPDYTAWMVTVYVGMPVGQPMFGKP